ncbi:site-specific DNA-methyltransferase, partial [Candidatus Micrarchaeota archaeon]|nr:site-specific DNA-methyltransferase [Candidatus Micrarchaeota archaeon]
MLEEEQDFDSVVKQERSQMGNQQKKQKDTARLVWASKPRKEPSAKDLVFQTAEEVYPNKATGSLSSFFEKDKQDISKNPNRLIWGDNLLVMQALLAHGYEGQIDLIYIDPPFNTGENFNFSNEVQIGNQEFEKELPVSERLAYTDTWDRGIDSFLDMLYPRLQLMNRLLSDKGSFYLHIDQTVGHYAKVVLDEIFGFKKFKREIIWATSDTSGFKSQAKNWTRSHDELLFYVKSDDYFFEKTFIPHKEEYIERFKKIDAQGRKYRDDRGGRIQYLDESKGKLIGDVWTDIESFQQASTNQEYLGYPTQKREAILERIIRTSSNENSLVADFFCGSGTTAAVAERLGRRWITSDLSKTAIQVARARFVKQDAKPFVIENLGNYQRQLIYLHEVKLKEMYDIILNLYGATPRTDKQGVGISVSDRSTLVYVCEPDRPMTARKAIDLAKEALNLDGKGYKHLVILAWDYDYNYDEDLKRVTKSGGKLADIESKIIPSDVYKYLRSTKVGDPSLSEKITFYQKPYVKISEPKIISKDGDDQIVKLSIEQYVVMDNPVRDEEKRK